MYNFDAAGINERTWLDFEITSSKVKVTDNVFRKCTFPAETYRPTVRHRRTSRVVLCFCYSFLFPAARLSLWMTVRTRRGRCPVTWLLGVEPLQCRATDQVSNLCHVGRLDLLLSRLAQTPFQRFKVIFGLTLATGTFSTQLVFRQQLKSKTWRDVLCYSVPAAFFATVSL